MDLAILMTILVINTIIAVVSDLGTPAKKKIRGMTGASGEIFHALCRDAALPTDRTAVSWDFPSVLSPLFSKRDVDMADVSFQPGTGADLCARECGAGYQHCTHAGDPFGQRCKQAQKDASGCDETGCSPISGRGAIALDNPDSGDFSLCCLCCNGCPVGISRNVQEYACEIQAGSGGFLSWAACCWNTSTSAEPEYSDRR